MRVFLALFVISFVIAGCDINNPIQPGPSDAPSRITLDIDEESEGDTAADDDLQPVPTRFENPLSSFDFETINGDRELKPDEITDPDGTDPVAPLAPSDEVDDDNGLEPEIVPDEEIDSDDELDPEVIDDDDDSGDDTDDDDDDFGVEVIE